ncbi:hypothetical protein CDAR_511391 [Caerostris darwini]|uniref:Uncharacterized protein n=1 Tax=Caerostris darwini TaxID=1538125 RepID=A0AAV4X4W0_9ARAC|nr:hypothetical protein CDAR_511391 [Caerostris darwini]
MKYNINSFRKKDKILNVLNVTKFEANVIKSNFCQDHPGIAIVTNTHSFTSVEEFNVWKFNLSRANFCMLQPKTFHMGSKIKQSNILFVLEVAYLILKITNTVSPTKRFAATKAQDLRNIAKSYGVNMTVVRNEKDVLSVDMLGKRNGNERL